MKQALSQLLLSADVASVKLGCGCWLIRCPEQFEEPAGYTAIRCHSHRRVGPTGERGHYALVRVNG